MVQSVRVWGFDPTKNGLHFPNKFGAGIPDYTFSVLGQTLRLGDASNGLCGGFVYTVKDCFDTGLLPPADTAAPAGGTPLFNYLVARLTDSFDESDLNQYLSWIQMSNHDTDLAHGLAWHEITEEWPKIKSDLDSNQLSPLGLVHGQEPATIGFFTGIQDLGGCHQVLAWGYDLNGTALTIFIYDPDNLGSSNTITLDIAQPSSTTPITVSQWPAGTFRGFFRTHYTYHDPRTPASGAFIETVVTSPGIMSGGPAFSANLLQNASFESSSAGWRANNLANAVNLAQYNAAKYGAGYAHDGSGFLEMNTSQSEGSVCQDVPVTTQPGQSYSFSVWLRAAPNGNPVSGSVTLWGLGGTQENGTTYFTNVGETWTLVTAPLDVQNPGHTSLRAEIYMVTTGWNFDVDGAQLINAGLQNASFESSSAGWRANNLANAVNLAQYNAAKYGAGYAHDGSGFLEMNTSQSEGSVCQDVPVTTQPGQSYSFSVWLRAAPNGNPVSGSVTLWGLGGTQENGTTYFTNVGETWTLVTAPLDVQNPGHTSLRAEIYMVTTGWNFDVDGANAFEP